VRVWLLAICGDAPQLLPADMQLAAYMPLGPAVFARACVWAAPSFAELLLLGEVEMVRAITGLVFARWLPLHEAAPTLLRLAVLLVSLSKVSWRLPRPLPTPGRDEL
jgi:hypothetical protein